MKRTILFHFSFLIVNIFLNSLSAQEPIPGNDSVFGFDQVLYNGRVYTFQVPQNAKGSPMFFEKGFETGSLTVQGITYENLTLNYDVYNQLLLLRYTDHRQSSTVLAVSESWVTDFAIGGTSFEMIYHPGQKPEVCQLFKEDLIAVRYYWKKTLKLDNTYGTQVYVFSVPLREQTVIVDGKEKPYRNNKDFLRAFNPSIQVNINNYLKINKIKVAKASDYILANLITYCNTQLSQ